MTRKVPEFICRCCRRAFAPDSRNRHHQRFCCNLECRQASKAASQRKWLGENAGYFTGHEHTERVQASRKKRMEEELGALERDLKAAEQTYGENVLNLTVCLASVKPLVENGRVVRFLGGNHRDMLGALEAMAAAETL